MVPSMRQGATVLLLAAAAALPSLTAAFIVPPHSAPHHSRPRGLARVTAATDGARSRLGSATGTEADDNDEGEDARVEPSRLSSRRDVLSGFAAASLSIRVEPAAASDLGTAGHPVAVLGGGGRTGMEVAEALVKSGGMYAVTMTRSGKDPFKGINLKAEVKERLRHYPEPVDVRDGGAVLAALRDVGASAVVFAASASKQGGDARAVDDVGVGNVAEAARATGCRLVLISALAIDRPESKSYKITNDMGGFVNKIMDAKLDGENRVRSVMGVGGKGDYVILRPGVLLSGRTKGGPVDLELNQGDTIGGGLSRDELAGTVVGALQSGKRGVTVEVYRRSTATKLQPEFVVPSGKELTATSYVGLFDNAKSDT